MHAKLTAYFTSAGTTEQETPPTNCPLILRRLHPQIFYLCGAVLLILKKLRPSFLKAPPTYFKGKLNHILLPKDTNLYFFLLPRKQLQVFRGISNFSGHDPLYLLLVQMLLHLFRKVLHGKLPFGFQGDWRSHG